jgi:hypothetical protein
MLCLPVELEPIVSIAFKNNKLIIQVFQCQKDPQPLIILTETQSQSELASYGILVWWYSGTISYQSRDICLPLLQYLQ